MTAEAESSTLGRMAKALEEQNILHRREQELRQMELKAQQDSVRVKLLETQELARANELAESERIERRELLDSCGALQSLVRDLTTQLAQAMEHNEARALLMRLHVDVRDLLRVVSTLSVALAAVLNNHDPKEIRSQLSHIQKEVLDILARSVEHGDVNVTAAGTIEGGRDVHVESD